MKEGVSKKRILEIILLIVYVIFVVVFMNMFYKKGGFKDNSTYRITKGECNSGITVKGESIDGLSEKGECINPGYYIDGNNVNVSIGNINCANKLEIENIEVDEDMNVYIQVKEKKSASQAKCTCSPSYNIDFYNEVNSVTLVKEDGTELDECI